MRKECIVCQRTLCVHDKEFCSDECHQIHCKDMLRYNLKGILGLGFCWEKKRDSFDLLEIQYKYKNVETGNIETNIVNFEEES